MPPSKYEIGNPGGVSQFVQPELALRTSTKATSSGLSDNTALRSPLSVKTRALLSGPESHLPIAVGSSSLSKSELSPSLHLQSHEPSSGGGRESFISNIVDDRRETYRDIIVRSFAPRVAVFASSDTEDFVSEKGFTNGLHSLLRPYGERLHGKVVIRDSMGGSRGWDDFSIRVVDSRALQDDSIHQAGDGMAGQDPLILVNDSQPKAEQFRSSSSGGTGASIDKVLEFHLRNTSATLESQEKIQLELKNPPVEPRSGLSPLYSVYLRKLLSKASTVPYETFSHPVTCLIAVSSHHPAPIEALRQLYSNTGHQSKNIPTWMGTEYLRYYVLVHDEENDDITKSTALFDLMKRHFGLHCHLLRLRRSQCVQTDDDSTKLPSCEWLSAEEEIEKLWSRDYADDSNVSDKYIRESDATAIKGFLREMVTQSIVPFMESRVMTWNEQVASRRRGLSGRFMSLSKRWTGFGVVKSTMPGLANVSTPSGSNYDYQYGFYPPETPQSTMRQLGDYAFMLRDWKLAYSVYDFLRSDFGHDKAWNYYAAANEMAAITSLLTPHASNSTFRSESLDQMLETASYSYLTRCSMPFNVIRCLTVVIELLKDRGPSAAGKATRWGAKMLEIGVLTPSAQALTAERIAECFESQTSSHLVPAGTYRRQAAFWSLLASDCWLRLEKLNQARVRLREASTLYGLDVQDNTNLPFPSMQGLWQRLDISQKNAGRNGHANLIDMNVAREDLESGPSGIEEPDNAAARSNIPIADGFTSQHAGHIRTASFDYPLLQDDGFE